MTSSHHPLALLRSASVLAVLLLAAAVLMVAPSAHAIAVVATSPVAGEEVVPLGTDVTVTFDVSANGVDGSTFTLQGPGGGVAASVTGTGTSWSLEPAADLQPGTTYTASLGTGISDDTGAPLAEAVSWSFTTDAPSPPPPPPPGDDTDPTVRGRSPGAGERDVRVGESVSATFSEEVRGVDEDTFTLRSDATSVRANVTGSGRSWTLNPVSSLQEDTVYTVRLTGGATAIRDLADNPLADTAWSFTTVEGAEEPEDPGDDVTRPRVVDRFPDDGDIDVAVDTHVRATFSEAVVGVDEESFTLTRTRTGAQIPAVVRRVSSSRWTLTPDVDLREDTDYTVTLLGGRFDIRDEAGNRLLETDWSFATGEDAEDDDVRRPTVRNRSPRDGAVNVSRRTDVRVTFSEAVRGVGSRTFRLVRSGADSAVSAEIFRNGSSRSWVLDPRGRLARGTRYVVVLRGRFPGIRDLAGNRLADTTWNFRTAHRR